MIAAIDRWIGKTLFVPLIVRFCQHAKWTQYHVHNFLYMVGSWMLLMAALRKAPDGAGLAFAMALVFTVKVGRDPGYQGKPSKFLRTCFLAIEPIHALAHISGESMLIAGPNLDFSCGVGVMWLAAEYARTIKTIPPLEERKPASEQTIEAKATVVP